MKQTIRDFLILAIILCCIGMSCMGQTLITTIPAPIKDNILPLLQVKTIENTIQQSQVNPQLDGFINEWLGTRYVLGGSTKRGIDCSNFNKKLYHYVYQIELKDVCVKQWNETTRVDRNDLKQGDLLFFRSTLSPSGWHCGVYIGDDNFVHSSNKKEGVKISSLNEPRYSRAFKSGGRVN
jgi:cell wall-associated NlpC family hydrolase